MFVLVPDLANNVCAVLPVPLLYRVTSCRLVILFHGVVAHANHLSEPVTPPSAVRCSHLNTVLVVLGQKLLKEFALRGSPTLHSGFESGEYQH